MVWNIKDDFEIVFLIASTIFLGTQLLVNNPVHALLLFFKILRDGEKTEKHKSERRAHTEAAKNKQLFKL